MTSKWVESSNHKWHIKSGSGSSARYACCYWEASDAPLKDTKRVPVKDRCKNCLRLKFKF